MLKFEYADGCRAHRHSRARRISTRVAILVATSYCSIAICNAEQATSPPPGSESSVSQRQDSSATSNEGGQLQEIVVTAEKRTESLARTPLAISAITGPQLQSAGVQSIQDLTTQVPNLEIGEDNFFGNAVNVTIRGLSSTFFDIEGDPAVATYIDGVYVPRTQGLNTGFFDLERVEVLRGPQGTLYGRNALGGAINVITAPPEDHFDASAGVSIGNYNDVQTQGMVNVPVAQALDVRAAFTVDRNNGYYDTEGTTSRNYGVADNFGGRVTALWRLSDSFKWQLSLEKTYNDGTEGMFIETAANGQPAGGLNVYSRPINSNPEPTLNLDQFSTRSRMTWELNPGLTLVYVAGYQQLRYNFSTAGGNALGVDGVPAQTLGFYGRTQNSNYMHEFDFNADVGNLTNTLGAAYFHEQSVDTSFYYAYDVPQLFRGDIPDYQQDALGLFDQASYNVTQALKLTAGVRYSYDKKTNPDALPMVCPATIPPTIAASANPATVLPGCVVINFSGEHSWSGTNWKAGADYQFTDKTFGFASVTTGFKEGGLNEAPSPTGSVVPYNSEDATDYELGVKTSLPDDSLYESLDVFYEDVTNLQLTQITDHGALTQNAGAATIYGVESETKWLLTNHDRLDAFLTYLHARYTNYKNAVDAQTGITYASLDGNELANAPEVSVRVRYGHDFVLPEGGLLTPSVDFYYQDVSYLREFNLPIDRVPSYTRTGADLTYTSSSGEWLVQGYANNLENTAVRNWSYTFAGKYYSIYNAPRTYGVRVTYKY